MVIFSPSISRGQAPLAGVRPHIMINAESTGIHEEETIREVVGRSRRGQSLDRSTSTRIESPEAQSDGPPVNDRGVLRSALMGGAGSVPAHADWSLAKFVTRCPCSCWGTVEYLDGV